MKFLLVILSLMIPAQAREFTLESSFENALRVHPQGKVLLSEVKELTLGIERIKSGYAPEVWGVVGGERRQGPSDQGLNQNRFVAELRFKYNLFRFNSTKDEVSAIDSLLRKKNVELEWWKKSLFRRLKSLFHSAASVAKKMNLLNKELNYNSTLEKMVKKRRTSGLVGASDLLDISMRKDQLSTELITLEEEMDHLYDKIRKASFLDHEDTIKVDLKKEHPHFELDLDELVSKVRKTNIDIQNKILEGKSTESQLRRAKKEKLPEVNLMGRYGQMRIDEQYGNKGTEGLVGVYVNIPIFDGGKRSSTQEIYKEKLKQKKLEVELLKGDGAVEITHKYEFLNKLHRRIDILELSSKRGLNYFKSVLDEYDRGIKNSLDLVSARDRMVQLNMSLIESEKNYLLTVLDIEELTGEELKEIK